MSETSSHRFSECKIVSYGGSYYVTTLIIVYYIMWVELSNWHNFISGLIYSAVVQVHFFSLYYQSLTNHYVVCG